MTQLLGRLHHYDWLDLSQSEIQTRENLLLNELLSENAALSRGPVMHRPARIMVEIDDLIGTFKPQSPVRGRKSRSKWLLSA